MSNLALYSCNTKLSSTMEENAAIYNVTSASTSIHEQVTEIDKLISCVYICNVPQHDSNTPGQCIAVLSVCIRRRRALVGRNIAAPGVPPSAPGGRVRYCASVECRRLFSGGPFAARTPHATKLDSWIAATGRLSPACLFSSLELGYIYIEIFMRLATSIRTHVNLYNQKL